MLTQTKRFRGQITKQFIGIMVVIIIFCSVVKRWTEGARGRRGHTGCEERHGLSRTHRHDKNIGRIDGIWVVKNTSLSSITSVYCHRFDPCSFEIACSKNIRLAIGRIILKREPVAFMLMP